MCWRALIDAALLPAWVPGLRRARVIAARDGYPLEVMFEYAGSLMYSLMYTYDLVRREVQWEPRIGRRDAVGGFARFDEVDGGTRFTYCLEEGSARAGREQPDPEAVAQSFARWVESLPNRFESAKSA